MPNDELISLPIPDFSKDIAYKDLFVTKNMSYMNIMKELIGSKIRYENHGIVKINDIDGKTVPGTRE